MTMNAAEILARLNEGLADWAIEVEGGKASALELYAFCGAIGKLAEEYQKQEVLKKAAHKDALLYGKEGHGLYGFVARATERASYEYAYPDALASELARIGEAKKRYEEAAKLCAKTGGVATVADHNGEEVAVSPAVAIYSYTVTLSKK